MEILWTWQSVLLSGGAFQSIINSLVNDIIMPAVSIITKRVDFSNMVFTVGGASIKYGNFITAVVNFLIIAFSIFLMITYLNKLNKKMESLKAEEAEKLAKKYGKKVKSKDAEKETEPTTKICPFCYSEVNYKATRCPHCTSSLVEEKTKEAEPKKRGRKKVTE